MLINIINRHKYNNNRFIENQILIAFNITFQIPQVSYTEFKLDDTPEMLVFCLLYSCTFGQRQE